MNTIENIIKIYEDESFCEGIIEEKVLRVLYAGEENFTLLTYDALNKNARIVEVVCDEEETFQMTSHYNVSSFEVDLKDLQSLINKEDAHDIIVAAEEDNGFRTLHTNIFYMSEDGQRIAFVLYGDNEEEAGAFIYEVVGNVFMKVKQVFNVERLERMGLKRVEL